MKIIIIIIIIIIIMIIMILKIIIMMMMMIMIMIMIVMTASNSKNKNKNKNKNNTMSIQRYPSKARSIEVSAAATDGTSRMSACVCYHATAHMCQGHQLVVSGRVCRHVC